MINITSTTLKNSYEAAKATMAACTASGNTEEMTVNEIKGEGILVIDIPGAASGNYGVCGVYGDCVSLEGDGKKVSLEKGKINLVRFDSKYYKNANGKAKFKLTADSGVNISSQNIKIGFVNVINTEAR